MACDYINGAKSLLAFVEEKLARYEKEEKNMETLFRYMFSESENPMAETAVGYRIKTVTYGECKEEIFRIIPSLKSMLSSVKEGSIVGLYMENSLAWIQVFWAILAIGYKPLLLNIRSSGAVLDKIIEEYDVKAVITDGREFDVFTVKSADLFAQNAEQKAKPEDLMFANEVIFMSSGTSDNVKLCSYRGKNFFYQIKESAFIIKNCPDIVKDCEGQIKHLMMLPLYHVFGFIAVYMWFGFFSRVFVFLKDMHPKTILSTVKKHKVTHIFAVPLLWDSIYKEVVRTVKSKGEKTYKKFEKGLKIASSDFGKKIMRSAFSEIREATFGESVRFMINGGSHIDGKVLKFFNAIGYRLTNGYGMTEIGITSVEISDKINVISSETIGKPVVGIEYMINDSGELCVRGKSISRKIRVGGVETVNDYEAWFNTKDLAREENGRYFILGRRDDLVVCENGENLNPVLVEKSVNLQGVDAVCLIADSDNKPVLVVSCRNCFTQERVDAVKRQAREMLANAKLDGEISKIEITSDSLTEANDFKISRKKVAKKYREGKLNLLGSQEKLNEALSAMEQAVCRHFASALKTDGKISLEADFFTDLGGTSLDYFELIDIIKTEYGVELPSDGGASLTTAKQVCNYLTENI
ncbi:MAG: AMP-binding protein [Clostridia bacterium]|nr:AMP-binding protein [Clostridia bacterium]